MNKRYFEAMEKMSDALTKARNKAKELDDKVFILEASLHNAKTREDKLESYIKALENSL